MSPVKIEGEKNRLSLDGKWLLNYFEEGEGEKLRVYLSNYLPQGWLESQVRGCAP